MKNTISRFPWLSLAAAATLAFFNSQLTVAFAQTWTTNELPAGLTACWQAESNFLDSVGTNNGTPADGVSFAAGRFGQGFSFSGANPGVSMPHALELNVPATGFTVEFWMKAGKDQPEAVSSIVDKDHSAQDNTGWEVSCWRDTGRLSFGIGDGSSFPLCTNRSDVLDNQFHHVAFEWDKINWLIYVDGVLENRLYRPAVANNTRPLRFGFHWGEPIQTASRYFKGALDEVRIYNRALSSAEIGYLNAGPTLPVTNGIKLHVDAGNVNGDGSIPGDGATVSAWRDIGGLGLDLTPLFGVAPVYRTSAVNGRAGVDFSQSSSDALASVYSALLNFTNCTIFMAGNGAGQGCHVSISAPCINQEFMIDDKAIYHHAYPYHYIYRSHQDSPTNYYLQAGVFGLHANQLDNWINGVLSTNNFGFGQQSPTFADVPDFTTVSRQAILGWRNSDANCNAPIEPENFGGVICEVLVYDRQLNIGELGAMTAYLAGKYNLALVSIPPVLQAASVAGGTVALQWSSVSGGQYQLQSNPQLSATGWMNEGAPFTGTGGLLVTNMIIGSETQKYFRLQLIGN
jgi:hypothetical protein